MFNFFKKKKTKPQHRRSFAAGKVDRLTSSWQSVTASADAAMRASLSRMRGRSRELAVNNDYARRFFKLIRSNVIGAQGISLQIKAINRETKEGVEYDDTANRLIESAWEDWSRKRNCSADGRLSLIDIKQLIVETVAKDGEIFVRKIRGRSAQNEYGFTLQLLEADHVDENNNNTLANGNVIRMGIEYNKWNRPVAYHVLTRHPGDTSLSGYSRSETERIPASEMLHLYITERVSQSRGLPWLISSMRRLNMLGFYEENELVAAGVSAAKMGFFKSADGTEYKGEEEDENGGIITTAEPGTFEQLPHGVDFVPWDPQHPASSFGFFIKSMLRGAASGAGVSYNSLANDLEGVNFSSIRQGVLEERELWKLMQTWMIEHFCGEIFEDWLLMALTTQKIPLPLTRFDKFNKPVWRPRGWSWVDPLKEVKSNIEAVNAGFMSAQDVASQQGQDIDDVYAQLALEQKLREKHGVILANPDMQGMQNIINGGATNDTQN